MPDHLLTWIGFCALVLTMLALDLGIFHRKSREVSLKEAVTWSGVWIGLALAFNTGIYYWHGGEKALQFLTGYLVELSLSVDNLFVFLLVFGYFKVPVQYRHRVLFWGIIGALIMRAVFIAAGVTSIAKFHWIIYLFGALLVASGIKMTLQTGKEIHPERNPVLKLLRRFMHVTPEYEGDRFFVKQHGRILATPLFAVLMILESTDLVFAVDSVPAVLAITPDPFIVFTSNVFCHPRTALDVFCLGRNYETVSVPALRAFRGATFCGCENVAGRLLQNSNLGLPVADCEYPLRCHDGLAMEQADHRGSGCWLKHLPC
jgi:tellurite resistance protein TerC